MLNETLDQLESYIQKLIDANAELQQDVTRLKAENANLSDKNETLQLEFLELEEKNKLEKTLKKVIDRFK